MDIKEIKEDFGDFDWLRAILNEYTIEVIQWMINRIETLESEADARDK